MISSIRWCVQKILQAACHSIQGLQAAWCNEFAFRAEVILAFVFLPLAFWLGVDVTQKALLVFAYGVILIAELCNSAVEAAIDRISTELHPLSKRAKDLGSAAVFVSWVFAAVVWATIGSQYLI